MIYPWTKEQFLARISPFLNRQKFIQNTITHTVFFLFRISILAPGSYGGHVERFHVGGTFATRWEPGWCRGQTNCLKSMNWLEHAMLLC